MSIIRKADQVTGWPAVGVLMALTVTKALTALVMSFPIAWLINHVFASGTIRAIFGADRVSYWHCVGMFAIWFAARLKIKFSGPALIEIEGDR